MVRTKQLLMCVLHAPCAMQEGSVDEVSFIAPELGPLAAVLVAPEGGSWVCNEVDVYSSRSNHTDRYAQEASWPVLGRSCCLDPTSCQRRQELPAQMLLGGSSLALAAVFHLLSVAAIAAELSVGASAATHDKEGQCANGRVFTQRGCVFTVPGLFVGSVWVDARESQQHT